MGTFMGSNNQLSSFSKDANLKRKRAWSVTAVGILLIVQAVFMFFIFPVLVADEVNKMPDGELSWLFSENKRLAPFTIEVVDLSQLKFLLDFTSMRVLIPSEVVTSLAYLILSVPTLIAGILFLHLWKHAWTLAVFLQSVILTIAIYVYFNFKHPYIFLMMVSGVLMVLYLNYYEVQLVFRRYSQ